MDTIFNAVSEAIAQKIAEVDGWVLVVLALIFIAYKIYDNKVTANKTKIEARKNENINSTVLEKLEKLTTGFDKNVNKEQAKIILSDAITVCLCQLQKFFINQAIMVKENFEEAIEGLKLTIKNKLDYFLLNNISLYDYIEEDFITSEKIMSFIENNPKGYRTKDTLDDFFETYTQNIINETFTKLK